MHIEKIITDVTKHKIWQGKDGKWRTYVHDTDSARHRKLIVRKDKADLIAYLEEYIKTPQVTTSTQAQAQEQEPEPPKAESDITLLQLYPSWKLHKGLLVEEAYMSRIESDWKKYYLHDPIATIPMRMLTKIQLEEWLVSLVKRNSLTRTAYYNITMIIRQMFRYAVDAGYLRDDTFARIHLDLKKRFRRPRKADDATQIYYNNEIERLAELAWADYHRKGRKVYMLAPLAVLMQLYCGLRISEVPVLMYSDIKGRTLHVQRMLVRDTHTVREYTKGAVGEREVYLTDKALEIVNATRAYRKAHGITDAKYIFSLTQEHIPWRTVNEYLERYCKRLDIPYRSSHKLRKTCLSSLVNAGLSLNAVREFAGHVDEKTTLRYYTYDRDGDTKNSKIEDALSFKNEQKDAENNP